MTTTELKAETGITSGLANFAAGTRYAELPPEVVRAGKAIVLDGLGCLVSGLRNPVAGYLLAYAREEFGCGPCTVLGNGPGAHAMTAAFVNGALLHVNDNEAQGLPPTHGTSNLLPVLLALAESAAADRDGAAVLTAFIAGWEVQARIRTAATRDLGGFHPPGVFGPLGAAAAAGNLLALSPTQLTMALGIAASRTGGLFANNGTMTKSTHPGNAGRLGLEAALLARNGFTANPDIFAAHHGYVETLFKGQFDAGLALDGLGTVYHMINPGFNLKPYPAEIFMQWVIDAVVRLRAQADLAADDVAELEIEVGRVRDDLSRPRPTSGLDGKFSYQYCAAVALTQERVGVGSFTDQVRFSPAVEDALAKVVLRENPAIPVDPAQTWAVARVRLRRGGTVEAKCASFRGSRRNPMSRDERLAKVRECMAGVLPEEQSRAVIEAAEQLETPGSLETILGVLRGIRHEGRQP